MKLYIPRGYYFPVAFLTGIAIGYFPAVWYFQPDKPQVSLDGSFVDMSYTVLRGVITGVDQRSKILHFKAVSPYSPYESAPFSVTFDEDILVRSAPPNPESSNSFLPSLQSQTVDTSHLTAGTPVTVRVARKSGTLRANWIAIRAPEH